MLDLGCLRAVPGLEHAVEAHDAAERMVALNPEIACGDRNLFVLGFALLVWAKAGGDNAALITALERAAARADDRDRRGEDA